MTKHTLPSTDNGSEPADNNQSILNIAPKIAIIGGGLTGLFTATLLERVFLKQQHKYFSHSAMPQITIFEKSRSVGRLATRYRKDEDTNKNWQWAFGAQFFTAKSDNFSQFIKPWLEAGLLQPWCAKVVTLTPANNIDHSPDIQKKEQWDTIQARYISTPKMTSWGRTLANNLILTTINFKTRIAPLNKVHFIEPDNTTRKTELFDETGSSLGWFDWVICTAPNGQAVELMADSGFAKQDQITKPKMLACYTLMLGWDDPKQLPKSLSIANSPTWDVAYVDNSILDRIFVEHHKPTREDILPSITIHARNDWSEQHVDDDIETVTAHLLAAAQQALNWDNDTAPSQTDCHRWRYAATVFNKSDEELGILVDSTHHWIVSGDWCGQGNIESCYRMAEETVEAITGVIDK